MSKHVSHNNDIDSDEEACKNKDDRDVGYSLDEKSQALKQTY